MKMTVNSRGLRAAKFLSAAGVATTIGMAVSASAHEVPASATSFVAAHAHPETLSIAGLAAAEKSRSWGSASADHKTLRFGGKTIRLVVRTGPANDMLSFRIAGIRNPTLLVSRGSYLKVLFANTDDDMDHDIRFGPSRAKFAGTPGVKGTVGSATLAHRSPKVFHADEMVIRAPAHPGTYAYYCSMRGHASGGMWGRIIVK